MYICMYKSGGDNKMRAWVQKNETYSIVDIQVNYSKIGWFITLMWGCGQARDLKYLL